MEIPQIPHLSNYPMDIPFPLHVYINSHAKQSCSMVFLINASHRQKANGAETFEVPFRGLWDERFHQPIFGCNNLTAQIQYYDEQPFQGDLSMRIDFIEGGVNTFLPVFNNVLKATRVQMHAEQQQASHVPPVAISDTTPAPNEYFPQSNMAFVDPNDPSHIYTTQPVGVNDERRSDAPSWSVSGGGLRRRA